MYTYLKVKNFRCFEELELVELARVNLIAGVNNIGKTALLEAIFLHGGYDPKLGIVINALRSGKLMLPTSATWVEHPMDSLFNEFDVSRDIELVSGDAVGVSRSIKLRVVGEVLTIAEPRQEGSDSILGKSDTGYLSSSNSSGSSSSNSSGLSSSSPSSLSSSSSSSSPSSQSSNDEPEGIPGSSEIAKVLELKHEESGNEYRMIISGRDISVEPLPPKPPFNTVFQNARSLLPEASSYDNLVISRKEGRVLQMLKIIEPNLQDIKSAKGILHGDIGTPRLMPLPLMGEGMSRLANLAVNIGNAPDGVVLVDEIENGLHHSVVSKVWEAIAIAARESNTQIFATTHSWECIKAAHQAFVLDGEYNFRLHRLGRQDDKIGVVTYDQETLDAAIEHELEVR